MACYYFSAFAIQSCIGLACTDVGFDSCLKHLSHVDRAIDVLNRNQSQHHPDRKWRGWRVHCVQQREGAVGGSLHRLADCARRTSVRTPYLIDHGARNIQHHLCRAPRPRRANSRLICTRAWAFGPGLLTFFFLYFCPLRAGASHTLGTVQLDGRIAG